MLSGFELLSSLGAPEFLATEALGKNTLADKR